MRPLIRSDAWREFPPGVMPGMLAVGLMVVWAVANGGYFAGTWYWGALVALALLTVTVVGLGSKLGPIPAAVKVALVALGLYVLWSYLSMTWALYPGAALEGSNRALMFWLLFALFALVPWTVEAALAALTVFVLAVGAIALVILVRLATGDHIRALFIFGRLASPLGYYNAAVALFTMAALVAIALAVRRELPVALRAVLLAIACASLPLALIGQSRGWLFTLPLVAIAGIAVVAGRLRIVVAAAPPVLGTLAVLHPLLRVYQASAGGTTLGRAFDDAAMRAGRDALLACAVVLVVGALLALADSRLPPVVLSSSRRRAVGVAVASVIVLGAAVGATVATHGRPFHFVSREWTGFSHAQTGSLPSSNFVAVGSGRYDFWRVGLDAFLAHPLGGLGQDNFRAYYLRHRRTGEQPQWTHSIEMRLLVHTGLVGLALFVTFWIAALVAAVRSRRRASPLGQAVAGAALLPLAVWTIHGSVDWFWEFPALSAPALGFLGLATALARSEGSGASARSPWMQIRMPAISIPARVARIGIQVGGTLAAGVATITLVVPYIAVAEISQANAIAAGNPTAALHVFDRAANLNPLSSDPGLDGGVLALRTGRWADAQRRFRQAIAREPGDLWEAWLGAGLAASQLGNRGQARHDFLVSRSINPRQPVTIEALARLRSRSPLAPADALHQLQLQF